MLPSMPAAAYVASVFAGTLLLSTATYYCIEMPFMKLGKYLTRRKPAADHPSEIVGNAPAALTPDGKPAAPIAGRTPPHPAEPDSAAA